MAVAKSYQELEIVGDVFVSSGRQYVNVKLKSGKTKAVRWYTDSEYRKMYPEAVAVDRSADPYYKPQKEVLGFTKGYITIFKGDTYSELDWFRASIARYARWWGWYIISTEEIPEDLPEPESVEDGIEMIDVAWPESMAKNKIYRYDPDGHILRRGDTVLVPTFDRHRHGAIFREATVINGNYRTQDFPPDKVLKKIVRVVTKN